MYVRGRSTEEFSRVLQPGTKMDKRDRRVGRNRSITKPGEIRAIHFTDHSEKSIGSLGDRRDPPFVLGALYSSESLEWLLGTRVGGEWYKVWFLGSCLKGTVLELMACKWSR